MGLSTKQVSGDDGVDWAAELSKPPPTRRQPPSQQQSEPPLNCPRCDSTNTKFCYYNNYNKSQPRHFCKSCKRHWTKGGTLRNVPVGGGRKNKRAKISNAATNAVPAADVVPRREKSSFFSLSTADNSDQKSMPNVLFQSLIHGLNASTPDQHQDQNTEFPFSSLSNFDVNVNSLIAPSYQSMDVYDHYGGNLEYSMEESTITTVDIPTTSAVPWAGPDTIGSADLPNYWNWNEIDALTSSDHLNIPWDENDDVKIKP